MNRPKNSIFALAVVLAFVCGGAAKAQNQLITITPATGAAIAVVTPVSVAAPFGLAFNPPTGKLYTWDGTNINEISKVTGAILKTIPNFSTTDAEEGDLAFDSTGTGFLCALGPGSGPDDVCKFDIATSTFTSVGLQTDDIQGLAFDAGNVLWGISGTSGKVYTINQANGAFTLVGNSGVGAGLGTNGGLAFDGVGNLFAAMAPGGSAGPSTLYSINKATGVATKIGAGIGFNGIVGIRFEPATGTLYGLVTAGAIAPGVKITQSGGSTNVVEGGATDTYNVVLTTAPTANVTVTINPAFPLSVAPAVLTFTPANWNVAQTVTVSASNDGISAPHTGTITHTAASADPAYNGIPVANVIVNITGIPGSSTGEGTYGGSSGIAVISTEGGYGSGGIGGGTPSKHHPPSHTALLGPFFPHSGGDHRLAHLPPGAESLPWYGTNLTVFNNSHTHQNTQLHSGTTLAIPLLGWAALAALVVSGLVVTVKKYVPPSVT